MQSTPEKNLFEYAVVRYLPDVEREEFINVGLIMMCKRRRWLKCRVAPNHQLIAQFNPPHSPEVIDRQLQSFLRVADGQRDAGPIATLEAEERFRWLTAVRSASFQTSRPHPGKTKDLDATFNTLFHRLIL